MESLICFSNYDLEDVDNLIRVPKSALKIVLERLLVFFPYQEAKM